MQQRLFKGRDRFLINKNGDAMTSLRFFDAKQDMMVVIDDLMQRLGSKSQSDSTIQKLQQEIKDLSQRIKDNVNEIRKNLYQITENQNMIKYRETCIEHKDPGFFVSIAGVAHNRAYVAKYQERLAENKRQVSVLERQVHKIQAEDQASRLKDDKYQTRLGLILDLANQITDRDEDTKKCEKKIEEGNENIRGITAFGYDTTIQALQSENQQLTTSNTNNEAILKRKKEDLLKIVAELAKTQGINLVREADGSIKISETYEELISLFANYGH
jgi:regulator of replication initiation timing